MKISYQPKFVDSFTQIWDYISLDSKKQANKFKKDLKEKIEGIVFMPYKCKKSIYFEDENIRDLIFKGYTVVYKIDDKNQSIIVIGIKKHQDGL